MTHYKDLSEFLAERHPVARHTGAWTKAEDKRLAELLASGMPMRDIAVDMNRGYDSVRFRRFVLDLPFQRAGRWTPEKSARLAELVNQGHTYRECADALGVSWCSARNHAINTLGLKSKVNQDWLDVEEQFMRDNWGKMSLTKMEVRLGRSRGAIRTKAHRMGLV